MQLFFFTPLPGLAVSTQMEMAREQGFDEAKSTFWVDTAKTFPQQRGRCFKALRKGHKDIIWIATLPVLAADRHDLRHVVNVMTDAGANIFEGATSWTFRAPFEEGLGFANFGDYLSKRRKLLDDPRGTGRSAKAGAKNRRMPDAEARMIWLDPTISTDALALEKMNSDPRYRKPWTHKTAWNHFGKAGRPPGQRPKPAKPDPV